MALYKLSLMAMAVNSTYRMLNTIANPLYGSIKSVTSLGRWQNPFGAMF